MNFGNSTQLEKFDLKKIDGDRIYSKNIDFINRLYLELIEYLELKECN